MFSKLSKKHFVNIKLKMHQEILKLSTTKNHHTKSYGSFKLTFAAFVVSITFPKIDVVKLIA